MATEVKVKPGGIGLGGLLAVLFIGLKLTGYIAWSWWWVLSPLWIPLAVVLSIVLALGLVAAIAAGIAWALGAR